MSSPFLTATWSNLCLITYAIEPSVLEPRVPASLTLDTREGQAFVSLVAFDFLDTRVFGVPWPGFRHFPEVNLRFYVRDGDRRGVMFVREFVPQKIVSFIARRLYNEPYAATPMQSWIDTRGDDIQVEHRWSWEGSLQRVVVAATGPPSQPPEDSVEHFFKEHQWGFGVGHSGETLVYEVRHPFWHTYDVDDCLVDVDFGHLYGSEFAVLEDTQPYSAVLAVGSEIDVFPKQILAQ